MKQFILTILSLSCLTAYSQDKIIIKLKDTNSKTIFLENNLTGISKLDKISSSYSASSIKQLKTGRKSKSVTLLATFPQNSDVKQIISAYLSSGLVEYAEADAKGLGGGVMASPPNDALYFRQWGLKNDGSFNLSPATAGADIDMEAAWDIEQGSSDIIVATMDSGLNLGHPEFQGRIWLNMGDTTTNGVDDDNNGYIDDLYGWDFANEDNVPVDDHGHGTNVTGIIAANGENSIGYSGVDRNCKLMTLKGLNANNFGDYSWWIEAIAYAVDNGAHVINLSVGGPTYSAALKEAIDYALENNVVVVACMMNVDSDFPYYPANYDGVIAVGSTNPDDRRSSPFFWGTDSGSNYGNHISVVAPGNFIYGLSAFSDTDYNSYWGGTSQATPLVSGLAALLLAQDSSRTPAQIKAIIEETAEDQVGNPAEDTTGFDIYYGHGRINAFNALSVALSLPEVSASNGVTLYPNPSSGTVTIEAAAYPAEVTVYNVLGQKVLEKQFSLDDNTFTIATAGTYVVTVKNAEGTTSKKIIIK